MNFLRVFPFIGAGVGLAAVVLSIIGVSTTYWFDVGANTHTGLWRDCLPSGCVSTSGGRPAALAITALIAIGIASILALFSAFARNKSDATNNLARLCGSVAVVLLFSSGILIAAALYTFSGAKYATGYSFTLMALAQFLSFLGAMLVAHWMGSSLTAA